MLELRPICEHCATALPPASAEARICSFECTFCRTCVEEILDDVCPNCGGGFVPRPIRPTRNWNDNNYLGKYPAGMKIRHKPIDAERHSKLAEQLRMVPPQDR